jgi:hypothetical protein
MAAMLALPLAPPAARALEAAGAEVDWVGLGLLLAIAGAFLLAAGILFHSPRDLIEDRLGGPRGLARVRDPIFQRVQLGLGFAFLLAGFGLELFGRRAGSAGAAQDAGPSGATIPAFWIGVVVLAAVGLSASGWWWSNVALRRHLRAFLREHPPDLEADLAFAREIGELYGVRPQAEDSVQSFLARLRRELGLGPRTAAARPPEPALEESDALDQRSERPFGDPIEARTGRARNRG